METLITLYDKLHDDGSTYLYHVIYSDDFEDILNHDEFRKLVYDTDAKVNSYSFNQFNGHMYCHVLIDLDSEIKQEKRN